MRAALAIGLVAAAACVDERARPGAACPTWEGEIAAALAPCATCHGGATPAGDYPLTSYLGVLGGGADAEANAIAGEASSRLLAVLDPATAVGPHAGQAALRTLLSQWVIDCELAYLDSPIHARGVLDPTSAGFHGRDVERAGWDLDACGRCHGPGFEGTAAAPTCTSCHAQGPDACDTCHEATPTTGAHPAHVGAGSAGLACAACHAMPTTWRDDGHVRRGGAADPPPAEVIMGGVAAITVEPAEREGPPSFEGGTCRNVYCHGDVLGASGGTARRPSWASDPPGPAPCGSCHGAPPPSHASSTCATCHPSGAAHLDGATQLGHGLDGCSACHGSAASPAPPTDLSGAVFTSARGVGAHQAHLRGLHGLALPIACATCHVVPVTIDAPGHLDADGVAEVTATLGWDGTTCTTSWCHRDARPRWTVEGDAACGTCHGIPPTSPPHTAAMTLTDCAACHPSTMSTTGQLLVGAGQHLDGEIDAP